ncbi:DNA-binding protein [Clostridium manihotivorum]|uniref:DNA-binding protein n=1 Tax=Clostridium manihotivorum TaxID=2320868 RepID=A0A410DMM0_9CLOT|nr:DNA-binding protein [Clostridium manihotivorum]QAA30324.1 DNA-binding protein [Clostridium manihotivorum]
MMKEELLELIQASQETGVTVEQLRKDIARGLLRGKKIGRKFLVARKDLNSYLGLENNNEVLELQLENEKLRNKIKGYEMQFETFKGLLKTLANIADA